jgi:hypothetical protein
MLNIAGLAMTFNDPRDIKPVEEAPAWPSGG